MNIESNSAAELPPPPTTAVEYKRRFGRTMMVLTQLRGPTAAREELCRIASVETMDKELWITVRFLNGQTRGFRPGMIRQAHASEEALEALAG